MNYKRIIIFLIAIGLLIAAIYSLSDDILTPYVSFEDAKKEGKYVQVIGKLDESSQLKHTNKNFSFTIIDKAGSKIDVIHNGTKPLNFEHAEQIVALGRYNLENKIFIAEKILTKCPSKYKKKL